MSAACRPGGACCSYSLLGTTLARAEATSRVLTSPGVLNASKTTPKFRDGWRVPAICNRVLEATPSRSPVHVHSTKAKVAHGLPPPAHGRFVAPLLSERRTSGPISQETAAPRPCHLHAQGRHEISGMNSSSGDGEAMRERVRLAAPAASWADNFPESPPVTICFNSNSQNSLAKYIGIVL